MAASRPRCRRDRDAHESVLDVACDAPDVATVVSQNHRVVVSTIPGATAARRRRVGGDARRSDGTAWCWGYDQQGQLGDGSTGDPVDHLRTKAVKVRRGGGFLTGVTSIATGISHSCARRSDGTAWCWGADEQGQLGDGTTGDPVLHARLKAAQVIRSSGPLTGVTRLDGGVGHTCAVRSDQTVRCWGRNVNGELGTGTFDDDLHTHPSRVLFP
jgi:alpha-tubulin suppressor-like RCC1 family protein